MNENNDRIKSGGDKIALLGLFIISLLVAQLIIGSRSAILLSEPIELTHTGLSAPIPLGNGWQSRKSWVFQDNAFLLDSNYAINPRKPTAIAQCQYYFTADILTPQERFRQKALEVSGVIVNSDRIQTDNLIFDWAHINTHQINLNMFIGTARLPYNHQFDVEVHEIAGDVEFAEKTFMSIINQVHLEDNNLLRTGAEMIADFKSKGIDNVMDEQKPQGFFLIEDARKRTIGFVTDILTGNPDDNPFNIKVAGFIYIRGRRGYEQATSFRSSNNYDEFVWKSETYRGTNTSGTDISLDNDGVITISKYGLESQQDSFIFSTVAIPDALLGLFSYEMLKSDAKEIIVDTISGEGKVVPTMISKVEPGDDIFTDEETAYILKLEPLDGKGYYEQIYLDNNRKIYKRLLRQEDLYTLVKASMEEIKTQFPERADHVIKNNSETTNKDIL